MEKDIKEMLKTFEATNSSISSFHLQFGSVQNSDEFLDLLIKCANFLDDDVKKGIDEGIFPVSSCLAWGFSDVISYLIHVDINIYENSYSLDIASEAIVNMMFALRCSYQKELEAFRKDNKA